jgi:diguanylate cyclase (GGDEF)-like protein/PAS domain S-box-containing protein
MMQIDPNFYRFILDSLPSGVCAIDRAGKIIFWNDGAEHITGHLRQDVLGHQYDGEFLEHMDSENNLLFGDSLPLMEAMREGRARNNRISLRVKNGHFVIVKLHSAPFRDESGSIQGAAEIFEESTSNVINKRVNKLAAYGCLDNGTGMLSHGMIEGHLRGKLAIHAKYPVPFCIMCISVDDLPNIRVRFGQAAVDATLRAAAQTIQGGLRPTDFVGRLNELELLAILNECAESEVSVVGKRLRKLVHSSGVHWWGDTLHVTISIGATPAHDNDTVESIVARAEQALRESSIPPGNCMVVLNKA